jgi:hypothetical protein
MCQKENMKHMTKAIREFEENKNTQKGLEETLVQSIKTLEARGKYTRNEPIMRETMQQFVSKHEMNAKKLVHVQQWKPSGVNFNPGTPGVVVNKYICSPTTACQI